MIKKEGERKRKKIRVNEMVDLDEQGRKNSKSFRSRMFLLGLQFPDLKKRLEEKRSRCILSPSMSKAPRELGKQSSLWVGVRTSFTAFYPYEL